MPRRRREDVAGALHHVWARGNRKELIYRDDFDRIRYLGLLAVVVDRWRWRCLGYCLMGNHVHLVIETREANLGQGMHQLHGEYATGFNRRHRLTGHVFEDRYGAKRALRDSQVLAQIAYVARNPVAAGLCERPGEWRWSSHAATAGLSEFVPAWLDVERTLGFFGADGGDPRARYVAFVEG